MNRYQEQCTQKDQRQTVKTDLRFSMENIERRLENPRLHLGSTDFSTIMKYLHYTGVTKQRIVEYTGRKSESDIDNWAQGRDLPPTGVQQIIIDLLQTRLPFIYPQDSQKEA